jgi:hypothetical protein
MPEKYADEVLKVTTVSRRKNVRRPDRLPILYAHYHSQNYKQGVMHNICPDGMYFESESPLRSGNDLYIKGSGHDLKGFGGDLHRAFRAELKWSRELQEDRMARYGFGVQFIAKSHLLYGINLANCNYPCDCCEERVADQRMHQTDTGLFLCPKCLRYMESLPKFIEHLLERRLLGNVI